MRRRLPNAPASHGDAAAAPLHLCPACGRDFVQPVSWEPAGDAHWWMFLRCAECGVSRDALVTNGEAERFEAELHARAAVIARTLRELDGERMALEADRFIAALERDLIDAADFAR